jgi:hypothetical protein
MANTPDPAPVTKTLGAYSGLDGQPIDAIQDQPVVVAKVDVMTRRLRDDPEHVYAIVVLDDGQVFHTWSEFLCEQLAAVPLDAFPVPTTFRKVTTAAKREVWKAD